MKWSLKTTHARHTKELKRNEAFTSLLKPDIAIYISYRYNIKHLYNIQIQTEYIANKKIIQKFAQMKFQKKFKIVRTFLDRGSVTKKNIYHLSVH